MQVRLPTMVLLVGALSMSACGGGGDDDDEQNTNSNENTNNNNNEFPNVEVSNQTAEVLTAVRIDQAIINANGFVAVFRGDGSLGGFAGLNAGITNDIVIAITSGGPLTDGETLTAQLHDDTGVSNEFEYTGAAGTPDPIVKRENGDDISSSFDVTVLANTPDGKFTLTASGITDFVFSEVLPPGAGGAESGDKDPDLVLQVGKTYAFENTVELAHPFEFIDGADSELLSQQDAGSLEADGTLNYRDEDGKMTFTVSNSFQSAVTSYRCGFHTSTMIGAVTVVN